LGLYSEKSESDSRWLKRPKIDCDPKSRDERWCIF